MAARVRRCVCGRKKADAEHHAYLTGTRHFTYHRCECGEEWTVAERSDHEPADRVTSGEVIAVHEALKRSENLNLDELLSP